jgi:hypothetical protein
MSIVTNISGATDFALQSAISAYSDEAYTNAKKLGGTGITSSNPLINTDTETYIGQIRWFKPLNPNINVASLTDSADGSTTSFSSDYLTYVKSVRTHGATQVNIKQVISQEDGLAKIGRDFAETRAQDEHDAILSVLRGVAVAEMLNGCATGSGATGLGGQTFDNDPTDKKYGFYVDLGAAKPVVNATTILQGAARAEGFLQAIGMGFKDYEPDYMYLATSPEVYASLRSANLVDQTTVTEGNITFNTIFSGKFRLIQTRAAQGFSTAQLGYLNAGAGVDIVGTKTSFLIKPGSIAVESLMVPNQVAVYRDERAYKGGGTTDIWYRWGYVAHPAGYNWNGSADAFASNADYTGAPAANVLTTTRGAWTRKVQSALSLGILPIFHS